jgi:hypothetical protein
MRRSHRVFTRQPPRISAFYLALTPWLAFTFADRSAGIGAAPSAAVALGVAAVLLAIDWRTRRPLSLPAFAVGLFATMCVLALATGDRDPIWSYDRALSLVALALGLFVSCGRTPMTAPYATGMVTPAQQRDPSYRRRNLVVTRWLALAFGLAGASLAVGTLLGGALVTTLFNWLLPAFILIVAAVQLTPQVDDTVVSRVNALDVVRVPTSSDESRRHLRSVSGE